MKKPKISVIITAYNVEKYIEEAIKSVFSQTFTDYEIIVVDDGSTDNTKKVALKYKDKLKYYYKENGGLASVRNYGIKKAKCENIAFLDGDDFWYPEILKILYQKMLENPDVGLVYSTLTLINESGSVMVEKVNRPKVEDYYSHLLLGNFISFQGSVIKKECFEKCGLLLDYEMYSDWEFFIRLALKYKIIFVDQPLFFYRSTKAFKIDKKNIYYKLEQQLSLLRKTFSADPNISRLFKMRCISNVYFDMAKFCFFRKQFFETISLNAMSILYMPLQIKAYTFFPGVILKKLFKLTRA